MLSRQLAEELAQDMLEYAILASFVVIASVAAYMLLRDSLVVFINDMMAAIQAAL